MGMRGLLDMYAQSPRAAGRQAYILGKSQLHMLQLLHNSFIAMVTTPVGKVIVKLCLAL